MNTPDSYKDCPFLCSWSGGKDSYFAFHKAIQTEAVPKVLLNVMNEHGDRSRSHGIPREVLNAQAVCMGLPIRFIESTWKEYEKRFINKLQQLSAEFEVTHAVFGDIDIASHRAWEEKVSEAANLKAILPIWQQDRLELVNSMIDTGVKAMIVSCQSAYAEELLGRVIDHELIRTFKALGTDACGENGEYHTLVLDGPEHKSPLLVTPGDRQDHGNYSFLNLSL